MYQVDYTQKRRSKKRSIETCPVCGKNGAKRQYTTGDVCFFHLTTIKKHSIEVEKSCFIKKEVS